ncbi:FYVE, RhoGEF and PH domain-containing protein 6-like isoform X1 [Cimex lectularius]|uniref:Uncharacterized protein n=2 Tax=Cimex lectularius TaxID=79782 RepID=A0A8I6TFD3_CIMLE|nr:FYVE, RhoGEF and PH domain-containing protein 6-like isoform X1 [Cimex lectularius]
MDNKHIKKNLSPTKPPLLPKPKFLLPHSGHGSRAVCRQFISNPNQQTRASTIVETKTVEHEEISFQKLSHDVMHITEEENENHFQEEFTLGSSYESLSNSSASDVPAILPNASFLHNESNDSNKIEQEEYKTEISNISHSESDNSILEQTIADKSSSFIFNKPINWANSSFNKGQRSETFFEADISDSEVTDSTSQQSIDCSLNLDSTITVNSGETSDTSAISVIKENSKQKDAFMIAKEFMTSEKVYLNALHLIVFHFTEHLKTYAINNNCGAVISLTDLSKIITTLPQLQSLNENLLTDIELRIKNWSHLPKIADVIVKKGPFLKLYSTYIKNFESTCTFLDECCVKYPKFAKALNEFENSEICKKLTLKHYMLKPVQRVPQYRLLLEKYLEQIDEDSTEYADTKSALAIVEDVLHHANSSIKLGDNLSKLLQIQFSLGGYEIIKPGREFIKEGELYKLSRKEMQLRYFVLLSDCLLYTTYSSSISGLRVKYELQLSGMKVYKHQMDILEFSIITSTRSFTLRARTEEECADWLNALLSAIKENNQRQLTFLSMKCMDKSITFETLKLGKEAPVWIQDKKTTMCQICTAEFTVTFRRHHCRCCGKVVCGTCSNNKAPLQYLKFQSARVCEECYDYLLKEFEDPANKIFENVKAELQLSDDETAVTLENLKASFKKFDCAKKTKKFIPQRLKEVTANDTGSQMSGWLYRKGKRGWKRQWFVLKEKILYVYKASHDVVAYQSIPVLGYTIDQSSEVGSEEIDSNLVFSLNHPGQSSLIFSSPSKQTAEMWITALKEATILK